MLDAAKCEFEEAFHDGEIGDVYYFTYPKELGEELIGHVEPPEPGDKIVSMCVSLTMYGAEVFDIAISPTVESGDSLSDMDWHDLYDGIHYDGSSVPKILLKKAVQYE